MEGRVVEEYPYTGEDINRVTGGYVKPGLLRMWISDGRLTPGPRAKSIRGGPRTFDKKTVFKVALMAQLRKHGVSLADCQDWAENFLDHFTTITSGMDEDADQDPTSDALSPLQREALRLPFYYVIKPDSGTVVPVTAPDWDAPMNEVLWKYGPSVLVIDIFGFLKLVSVALDSGSADDLEEADADASQDGDTAA